MNKTNFGDRQTLISTEGAKIKTIQLGKGEPLLLLHGYPQTHVMWHKIAPLLAQKRSRICFSLLSLVFFDSMF